jgi:hypothetical protein
MPDREDFIVSFLNLCTFLGYFFVMVGHGVLWCILTGNNYVGTSIGVVYFFWFGYQLLKD